jgi:hypothetical protein
VKAVSISPIDARFVTDRALREGEAGALQVKTGAPSATLSVVGVVRQCLPDGHSGHCIDFEFLNGFPDKDLSRICQASHADRRREVRSAVSHAVRAFPELGTSEGVPGRIVDHSESGCRLLIDSSTLSCSLETGSRLRLNCADWSAILVQTAWQSVIDDIHAVGCVFLDPSAKETIRRLEVQKEEAKRADGLPDKACLQERRRSLQLAPWIWIGLLFGMLWYVVRLLLNSS